VVYSLWQHGRTWGPLRLEQVDASGAASGLLEDLGVPAGMDRTMVAVWDGAPVGPGARVRLSGQHRFLWDQIRFASAIERLSLDGAGGSAWLSSGGQIRFSTSSVARAELGYHGFSRLQGDRARHEQTYVHDERLPSDKLATPTGLATRYGDVAPLLRHHDDQLVVLVPGDRVEVDFAAPAPVPPGRSRTFFLRSSGWAKEAGFHNATGGSIAPLPRRGMSSYPEGVSNRASDPDYEEYLRSYQTREIRRRPL
jgi:hypothetical protein